MAPQRNPAKEHHEYILRDIPPEVWERANVKAKAEEPPLSMKWLLLRFLKEYAKGVAAPTPAPVAKPPRASRSVRKPKPTQTAAPDLETLPAVTEEAGEGF